MGAMSQIKHGRGLTVCVCIFIRDERALSLWWSYFKLVSATVYPTCNTFCVLYEPAISASILLHLTFRNPHHFYIDIKLHFPASYWKPLSLLQAERRTYSTVRSSLTCMFLFSPRTRKDWTKQLFFFFLKNSRLQKSPYEAILCSDFKLFIFF